MAARNVLLAVCALGALGIAIPVLSGCGQKGPLTEAAPSRSASAASAASR